MTVTEGKEKKSGLPDGAMPPTIDQLPEEEKFQLAEQDPVIHELTNHDYSEERENILHGATAENIFNEEENALDWFQKKTTEGFKYWAGFTEYIIKMDDGSKRRYKRVPITKYESDELLDVSAEIQSMKTIDYQTDNEGKVIAGKVLNPIEVRQRGKLLDQLKAKYYLRDVKTGKPMSIEEVKHVADSTIIDSILEACFAITIAKWAEGKK